MSASVLAAELEGVPNPFRSGITRDAWDREWVDAPEIHAFVSARICAEISAISERGGSRGILLFGEPGSGKTHLLNRIRRWCLDNRAVFSGFRLQCAPQTLWRHLRREFAADLFHELPDGSRQIDRLAGAGQEAIRRGCGFALARVMQLFQEGRFLHECESWLKGDRLPESALHAMGLAEESDIEEEAEDEARRVLKELIALAAPSPVVLALDQVEAMQSDSQDPRGLKALGSAAAALRDESGNLALVTCVQTSFLGVLGNTLHAADMDRINEVRLELKPLDTDQARQLLVRRLEAEPRLRGDPRRRAEPLWPLSENDLRQRLAPKGSIVARKLIYAARDRFEQLRGVEPAAQPAPERFLRDEFRRRFGAASERAGWEGNEFLLDGLRRLMPLAGWRIVEPRPRGVDLCLENAGRKLALAMFNQSGMRGAAQRLKAISEAAKDCEVRLLRAEMNPISSRAVKTAEELRRLEESGVRLVRLSSETLAVLEACRTLLADAAAGDLHCDGEALPQQFVEQWLKESPSGELGAVAAEIEMVETSLGRDGQADALVELIGTYKVLSVEEAAARLGIKAEEARRCADQVADKVASVGSPAQVLYERRGA